MKWYCSNCRKAVDSLLLNIDVINTFEKKIARIEKEATDRIEKVENELKLQKERMAQIEEGVQTNEQNANTKNNEIQERIETITNTYARATAEGSARPVEERNFTAPVNPTGDSAHVPVVDEDEERKRSIIIHNLEESTEDDTAARIDHDTKTVVEICKYLGNDQFSEYSMEKIFRLGKREPTKKRPLKICLNDNITKFKIIRNTHKLRDSEYHGISIQHDLSSEQRKELAELINIAKKKEEEDPTGNYIYRVRGPPGRKHIKRIRKSVEVEDQQDPPQQNRDHEETD